MSDNPSWTTIIRTTVARRFPELAESLYNAAPPDRASAILFADRLSENVIEALIDQGDFSDPDFPLESQQSQRIVDEHEASSSDHTPPFFDHPTRGSFIDVEIDALAGLVTIFEGIEPSRHARMLQYLTDRY